MKTFNLLAALLLARATRLLTSSPTTGLCLLAALFLAGATAAPADPATNAVTAAKSNPDRDLARQLNHAFVEVAEEVTPCVVVIDVDPKAAPAQFSSDSTSPEDGADPMDEFRRFFRGLPPANQPAHGQGSGVIIRKDGYILTNRHVVEDAATITVRLQDGRVFSNAVVRGVDAPSDVAVIKIPADNLPVATLADSSKTRVGEFAIAIGAPFALDYSVTFGHVSAKDRSNIIEDPNRPMTDQDFIQTDANINPGNSGGPLVNIDGEVIGINTLIRGLRTGIGFAIPSNLAKEVADELIAQGKFTRSWLGIAIRNLRESEFHDLMPELADGVAVLGVKPAGPAAKSDLHAGDVITAVDGKSVTTEQQLKDEIRRKKVGQEVILDIYRLEKGKGGPVKVSVKPGEWQDETLAVVAPPTQPPAPALTRSFGLNVSTLTQELADRNHIKMVPGVIVTGAGRGGLASRAGLRRGDIITAVNQKAVASAKEFQDAEKAADLKKGAVLNVIRNGESRYELLRLPGN